MHETESSANLALDSVWPWLHLDLTPRATDAILTIL